ncbi:MAG: TetR/AcrR family transcriptional regulator, partial [Clostridiales bacterium]|nr:TetR/AcrR family transcriptional regulator [Clostridiales bacterium]
MNRKDINPKQTILSTAKEIAKKQGINKISIRQVVKLSGISIGTVYNYYSTKADLLVAVIGDFWKEAFMQKEFMTLGDKGFYNKIQEIYESLYKYLSTYKTDWLKQMALLTTEEKKLGRIKEKEYFSRIYDLILSLMDSDETIREKTWENGLSKEKMAEF